MRQFTLALLIGALSLGMEMSADNVVNIQGVAVGLSPDASQVVGSKGLRNESVYTSFRYTVASGEMKWLTNGESYMGSHLDGGRFTAINNTGIIAGTVRNPDMRLPKQSGGGFAADTRNFSDDEEGEAISSAAVWRNDKLYVLGCGPYGIESFSDYSDGSAATGISPDGNIVFGNIVAAWMPVEACIWVYDAASDSYEYQPLMTPGEALMSAMTANADAGFPAIGAISISSSSGGMMNPALWAAPDSWVSLNVPDSNGARGIYANAISADGHYMAISVDANHPKLLVYDIQNEEYTDITLPSTTTEVAAMSITNDGNMIVTIQDSNWQSALYYCDFASGAIVGLNEYFADTMPDYDFSSELKSAQVKAVSGDGKTMLIQPDKDAVTTLLLTMDNPSLITVPAPTDIDLYNTAYSTLEVKFDGIETVPTGCQLTGYKVFVDNKEVSEINTTETGGTFYASVNAESGVNHSAYICSVYTKNGESKMSGKSPVATTYVSTDRSLLNFYDFDDSTIDDNGNITWAQDTWQVKNNYGVAGEYINWHFTANDFENRTPALTTVSAATEPWSTLFVSHFMDASDYDNFFLDLRYQLKLVNSSDQDLTSDFLEVEVSTDGRNWTPVATIEAANTKVAVWNTLTVDLGKSLAGKEFQIRLNAHGEGIGQVCWSVDNISIANEYAGPHPSGLRYDENNEGVKLMWLNSRGMYDVSYLDNSAILWDYNVGNEGKPLIGAIQLTDAQLAPFDGEYITGVSTFLYDDPSIPQAEPTRAEAIIYANGMEVARESFVSDFNTVQQAFVSLSNPVKIEKGKTYRVAVRISNYATEQAPMYYQAASTSVKGVTDLYSEDEGATWHDATAIAKSDVNPNGYCVWPIRVYISADPMYKTSLSDVLYYDVFRDGVKVNQGNLYEPHPWISIARPFDGIYTVQAHYSGGVISPLSEPIELKDTSVKQNQFTLKVTTGYGTINIDGDCKGAVLYDMSGRIVASSNGNFICGVPSGVYILRALTATGSETFKIMVK